MAKEFLSQLEELVLLIVMQMEGEAYGVPISDKIYEVKSHRVSTGTLYSAIGRLEKLGLIEGVWGDATSERGGKRKRFYTISPSGKEALREIESVRHKLVESFA